MYLYTNENIKLHFKYMYTCNQIFIIQENNIKMEQVIKLIDSIKSDIQQVNIGMIYFILREIFFMFMCLHGRL